MYDKIYEIKLEQLAVGTYGGVGAGMSSSFKERQFSSSGPPAPPRRTDDNIGWPKDEFDDDEEDGDMYEAPPCERPLVKVPQRPVEENVYLGTTSNPAVPQRQAAPPPRMGKPLKPQQRVEQFNFDPKIKKPPEIDRTEKPGRKKITPTPPVRPSPAPIPAPNTEEDVYLDPNEKQEDNDELYLEPTAACPPDPPAPMRMHSSPSPIAAFVPPPRPVVKPPVPRAESMQSLHTLNEAKTAPLVEAKRAAFSPKPPPPAPSMKPSLPANLKEVKPSPPVPPSADKPVVSSGVTRAAKQSGPEAKEWFAGDCSRKQAEDVLERVNKDGAFLIRNSSAQKPRQPYTLAVLYQQKVYNIPIRFLGETQGYALGKEGKKNEEIFVTLEEMISHHKNNQLLLIDSKSQAKHTAYLTHPARP
ncbi:B-cell linker protein-like [Xyrichtys novacula]|uniref:B-cell linker protein-like n=1 Tax=Xyrichtys novacula TaxID=13765 RepID=A0AAV1G6Z2_XYRNO|nr:B-cell linker protein-like [Xyrichtys novacula]